MKKLKLLSTVVILGVMTLNVNAQSIFKVTKSGQNHANMPLGSNLWITNNTTNGDFGKRIRFHHSGGDGFIDFWPSFYIRRGNPNQNGNGALVSAMFNEHGMMGINMKPWDRTKSGYDNWQQKLWVNGRVVADAFLQYSDVSLKTNINPLPNALSKIMQLAPISYKYRGDKMVGDSLPTDSAFMESDNAEFYTRDTVTIHYGFTAQELDTLFPDLVANFGVSKGVNYVEFVPVLVKGIQEQQKIIDTLKKKNDSLMLQIENLRQEIINWQGRSIDTIGQSRSRLFQNNPNPFDGNTNITYFIDENTSVTSANIEVRNIMGNLQSTIVLNDGTGLGTVTYNGSSLTAGYYIYTLKINGSIKDSKMFLKEQ